MRCPDDARLDLWLDGALGADADAAAVAAHVAGCPACETRVAVRQVEERLWRAALALHPAELAHLATADLAAAWHAAVPAARPARWWPALVVLALAGTYAAWLAALPTLELVVGLANRAGLLGMGVVWALGQTARVLATVATALAEPPLGNPALVLAGAAGMLWLMLARPWALQSAE